jgi:hypothetical protein
MSKQNELSKSLVALEQDATLIAVVEMGQASWLVAGIVPGLDRYPLKKLGPDRDVLLQLPLRWRNEAAKAGHAINRIAIAYKAGREGFGFVNRHPKLTPDFWRGTDGSARPGGAGRGCAAGASAVLLS